MRKDVFDRFSAGLFLGAIAALFLAWLFDSDVADEAKKNWINLATILSAIAASSLALLGVSRQIAHQNDIIRKKELSELAAERASLPLALNRICDICQRGIQEQVGFENLHNKNIVSISLTLEATHIDSLKATIKLTSGSTRDCFQAILRSYQPTLAMHPDFLDDDLIDLKGKTQISYNRISTSYRWATLYTLASASFDFARGKSNRVDPNIHVDNLLRAVRLAGANPNQFEDFEGFFRRAAQRELGKPISDLE